MNSLRSHFEQVEEQDPLGNQLSADTGLPIEMPFHGTVHASE